MFCDPARARNTLQIRLLVPSGFRSVYRLLAGKAMAPAAAAAAGAFGPVTEAVVAAFNFKRPRAHQGFGQL